MEIPYTTLKATHIEDTSIFSDDLFSQLNGPYIWKPDDDMVTDLFIPFKDVNVYAIIIVLCISIDKSNIRTRSLRNTHSQETQHLSWETL
jgi:hypothetical protein